MDGTVGALAILTLGGDVVVSVDVDAKADVDRVVAAKKSPGKKLY